MAFRDDNDALRVKAVALEQDLAEAEAELEEARPKLERVAELEARVAAQQVKIERLRSPRRRKWTLVGIAALLALVSAIAAAVMTSPQEPATVASPAVSEIAPRADAPAQEQTSSPPSPEDVRDAQRLAGQALGSLNRGQYDAARTFAERAVAEDPANATGWLVLGAARGALGDTRGAREAYEQCVAQGQGRQVRECRAML